VHAKTVKNTENTDGQKNEIQRKNKENNYSRPKFGTKKKVYFENTGRGVCILLYFFKYNGQMSVLACTDAHTQEQKTRFQTQNTIFSLLFSKRSMRNLFLWCLLLCARVSDTHLITISESSHIQNICFFKDGSQLPKYLTHYDFLDILHSDGEDEKMLHINSKNAIFDTIVIEKKKHGENDTETNYLSVIQIHDDTDRLLWTGCFSYTTNTTESFNVKEFMRRAPLTRVEVIDTFPYNGDFIAYFHVQYLFDYVDEFIIVESLYTHNGERKPHLFFLLPENELLFAPFMSKITYVVLEEFDVVMSEEWKETSLSMDYITEKTIDSYWKENYQYRFVNFFIKPTHHLGKRQIVLVCDADEIAHREVVQQIKGFEDDPSMPMRSKTFDLPVHMYMRFFYYNFNTVNKFLW
jgi:hypothetical protein